MAFITRSLLVLLALYGMVFVLGDLALLHAEVSLLWGVLFAVILIGLQFAFAPWLIERVFTIWWDDPDLPAVPAAQREFVEQLCRNQGLPPIRLGVIESGTPNAFAFGRFRSDARIVVTRGLLDILSPEEVDAVLAHEVGHVAHCDFAIMAAAALAPLLLYQVFVWCNHVKQLRNVAWSAYLAYWVGQFMVLLLNRTREYHADHFSACVTRAPNQLSSALVKIAYGMVRAEGEFQEARKLKGDALKTANRNRELGRTVSLLGIASVTGNGAFGLGLGATATPGMADPAQAASVMRWDLQNPWARWYELNSTHPLTALRVQQLNRTAADEHQGTDYPLPAPGKVNRGRFAVELFFWLLPVLVLAVLAVGLVFRGSLASHGLAVPANLTGWLLVALGVSWAARILFRYHGEFLAQKVADLLDDMDVSQMRPRAVELRGEVVGNGVPGAFWSPDLVLRDDSGLMFLLFRSSIPFGRLWFGIGEASRYIGEQVTVTGWYRRGNRPYVELNEISAEVAVYQTSGGMTSLFGGKSVTNFTAAPRETKLQRNRSYSRWIQLAAAAAVSAVGLALL